MELCSLIGPPASHCCLRIRNFNYISLDLEHGCRRQPPSRSPRTTCSAGRTSAGRPRFLSFRFVSFRLNPRRFRLLGVFRRQHWKMVEGRIKLGSTRPLIERVRAPLRGVGPDWFGLGFGQVETSDVLIDGCLFEDCYASKKGGGFHQEDGHVSVINSLFYNSTVGSVNEESGAGIAHVVHSRRHGSPLSGRLSPARCLVVVWESGLHDLSQLTSGLKRHLPKGRTYFCLSFENEAEQTAVSGQALGTNQAPLRGPATSSTTNHTPLVSAAHPCVLLNQPPGGPVPIDVAETSFRRNI